MTILRIVRSMDPSGGGVAEAIRQTARGLAQLGHECVVLCLDDPEATWLNESDCETIGLGNVWAGYGYSPRLIPWLRQNGKRFDVIIADGLWLYPTQATARALRAKRIPYYVMPHGMLDPYFQREPSRRMKAIRNTAYWGLFEKRVVNDAAGMLFTCEQELLLARETFSGYRPQAECVVGLGIEESPAETPEMAAAAEQAVPGYAEMGAVLYLGRLHPKKGVDLLIRAHGELAKTHGADLPDLVIAGPAYSESYRGELDALARNVSDGRSGIHFVGEVRGALKWGLIRGAGAMALASHQENFGIAIVEAIACGTPVLISDKVNIWREIDEDGAGLVAPDTEEGTRELISRWLSMDAGGKAEVERAARACFEKRFNISTAAAAIAGLG